MSMAGRFSAGERSALWFFEAGGAHDLTRVVWSRFIQYRMLKGDQKLVVSSTKAPGQRKIAGLHDNSLADHVPELFLGYPELLLIVADDQSGLLYFHRQRSQLMFQN